jgi:hypothetical protein
MPGLRLSIFKRAFTKGMIFFLSMKVRCIDQKYFCQMGLAGTTHISSFLLYLRDAALKPGLRNCPFSFPLVVLRA